MYISASRLKKKRARNIRQYLAQYCDTYPLDNSIIINDSGR